MRPLRAILVILLYSLICGAISLGIGTWAGLGWQIGFIVPAAAGSLVLGWRLAG